MNISGDLKKNEVFRSTFLIVCVFPKDEISLPNVANSLPGYFTCFLINANLYVIYAVQTDRLTSSVAFALIHVCYSQENNFDLIKQ